jgi:hypothetical protein
LLFVHHDASACHNTTLPKTDPAIATIKEAERLVDGGNPKEAVAWVMLANPGFATKKPGASPLSDRALSVLARAAVRSGGEHCGPQCTAEAKAGPEAAPPKAEQRQAALAWALKTSRTLHQARSDDPAATTNLGEALAAMSGHEGQALQLLRPLEKNDLVTSPYAYAALARLRSSAASDQPAYLRAPLRALGDGLRRVDRHRCERMAQDPAICTGGAATPAKPNHGVRSAVHTANQRVEQYNRMVHGGLGLAGELGGDR